MTLSARPRADMLYLVFPRTWVFHQRGVAAKQAGDVTVPVLVSARSPKYDCGSSVLLISFRVCWAVIPISLS